jgi:hypothetical protein
VNIASIIEIVGSFCDEARRNSVPVPLTDALMECLRLAAADEGEGADLTTLVRPMERAAGVTLSYTDKTPRGPSAASPAHDKVAS